MRISVYKTVLDADRKNILVKEESKNLLDIRELYNVESIVTVFNTVFHANILAEEHLWLIAVDTKLKPIGFFEISHGTVDYSLVSPREIFVRLCLCGASRFFLVHNHPSGDSTPSEMDINVTMRLKDAGALMQIPLVDHIIIGDSYYSFCENGYLNNGGKEGNEKTTGLPVG